jgi:hypothetical protein
MNFDDRVAAVAKIGVTERQARLLVTVMLRSGLYVPRQFATFAGIAYGHKVSRFFDRLATREYATECGCLHNRRRCITCDIRRSIEPLGSPTVAIDDRARRGTPSTG